MAIIALAMIVGAVAWVILDWVMEEPESVDLLEHKPDPLPNDDDGVA